MVAFLVSFEETFINKKKLNNAKVYVRTCVTLL